MTLTDYEKYHLHDHVYSKTEINKLLTLTEDRLNEIEKDIDTIEDFIIKLSDNRVSGMVFVIWAEENGTINSGQYEWSFGNGASNQSEYGFPMPIPGQIISASTCLVCSDGTTSGEARIAICINGQETHHMIIHPPGKYCSLTIFDSEEIFILPGERINFRSKTDNPSVSHAIISLLIKLV